MSIEENNFYKSGLEKYENRYYHSAIYDFSKAIELEPSNKEAFFFRGSAKFNVDE